MIKNKGTAYILYLTVLTLTTRRLRFLAISQRPVVFLFRPFASTLHWDWLEVLTHKQLSDWTVKLFMNQTLFGTETSFTEFCWGLFSAEVSS